ncbi:MAG: ABC transporter ATP-binding protein [Synergistaceae bacterium]|jgi:oligopeptide/dipeptide ABC transporter ATP-binding protein|nr:ABC transporter ATP-binding protein [Synergistaceae bacterium]
MIEVIGLKKYFSLQSGFFERSAQKIRAIDGVSLTVKRGEIVGLVGESGSGKTTLARVILKLTAPTEGAVKIDGVDITKATAEQEARMRAEISVVFQDPASNLNPRQTVESSIMRPMVIHGVKRAEAKARAREAMSLIKMDERYLNSYPHQLSGGQLQRIAIARALVLRPKVMILDEPTSALDISVQAQVLNLLLDLQESMGLTYLIITHDLNVIRYFSDRVAVMYLGKLIEYGLSEEVAQSPLHPYTQGLMAASPILDPAQRGKAKHLMAGETGSLIDLPRGCRFYPRCEKSDARCENSEPPDVTVGRGHIVSCFLYEGQSC